MSFQPSFEPNGPFPPRARAPTQAEWDAMNPAERQRVIDTLPIYIDNLEDGMSEGDHHSECRNAVFGALRAYFEATGRRVYLSGGLATYFPGALRVSPDVFAVMDCDPAPRDSWIVSHEGRGPQWVLEILVRGNRWKDLKHHVVEYAQLGIPEYFVLDRVKRRLWGYRLVDPAIGIYQPVVPQQGRYRSEVLGLDLVLDGDHVRFYQGTARLLEPAEVAEHLADRLNDEEVLRREAEERAATEAAARAEADAARAEAEERAASEKASREHAEAELAALRAEIERLRKG